MRSLITVSCLTVLIFVFATGAGARGPDRRSGPSSVFRAPAPVSACTISFPETDATVEVQIANAADFCELVSQALADEVFRSPVIVTPDKLWHYADGALSCRLQFRHSPSELTIRNAPGACRWFARSTTGWHIDL